MKLSTTKIKVLRIQCLLLMLVSLMFLPVSVLAQSSQRHDSPAKLLKTENPLPNRYIVVFNNQNQVIEQSVSQEQVASVANDLLGANGSIVDHIYNSALKGFSVEMSESQALALSKDEKVKYVVEDGTAYPSVIQYNPPSWGLDRIDQRNRPLSSSYEYIRTGAGVRAYVIDTGVLPSHQEFGGRATIGADFVNDGQNGVDCNGHGTHVSGTIAGSSVGVAKQASVVAVRVFGCSGGSSWSTIIAGVDWVSANRILPAVANMSLGGGANQAVDDAVRNLINRGVTVAVAAGNSGDNANNYSPARVSEAITVGASDINDVRASFSNYGTALDLFAPGVNITSSWSNGGYNTISGTSMATPHVAGVAALYLQAYPSAAPVSVRNVIVSSATPGVLSNIGPGSPNLLLYSRLSGLGGGGGDVHFTTYGNDKYDWHGVGCYDVAQSSNPAASNFRFQMDAVQFVPNPGTSVARRAGFTFPNTSRPHTVILNRTAPHIQLSAPATGADTTVSIEGDPNQSATIRFRQIGGSGNLLGTIVVFRHPNGVFEYSAKDADGTNLRAYITPDVVVDAYLDPGWNQTLSGLAGVFPATQNLLSRGGQPFSIDSLRTDIVALNQFATSWSCPSGQSLFEAPADPGNQGSIQTIDPNGRAAAEQACETAGVPRLATDRFESCVFDVVSGREGLGQIMAAHAGAVFELENQPPPQPGPDPCTPTTPTTPTTDLLRQNMLGLGIASRVIICSADPTNGIDVLNTKLRTLFDNQLLR